MENQMETGVMWGLYWDPSIPIIPTLGPKICKYYLHWAIWTPRECISYRDQVYKSCMKLIRGKLPTYPNIPENCQFTCIPATLRVPVPNGTGTVVLASAVQVT